MLDLMNIRHVPQRTCISCGTKRNKSSLIRIVSNSSGSVVVDILGKMNGRGVYLCYDKNCWDIGISKEETKNLVDIALSSSDPRLINYEELKDEITTFLVINIFFLICKL